LKVIHLIALSIFSSTFVITFQTVTDTPMLSISIVITKCQKVWPIYDSTYVKHGPVNFI